MVTRIQTQPNKLNRLAGEIRQRLEAKGDAAALHRPLPHGLQVVMQRQDRHRWRLALGREGVYPSDTEVEICRKAFAVPEAAELAKRTARFCHPKSKRVITYYVAELTWVERDRMPTHIEATHHAQPR